MTKQPITQSQKRYNDSLASLFRPQGPAHCDFVFLKSSSDVGVERNGGRNGARFAPQSFLAYFKRLTLKAALVNKSMCEFEVSSGIDEKIDFNMAQKAEAQLIHQNIKNASQSFICHLGGGHDHIYPLLCALGLSYKKVIVVNIDAHADTRTDSEFHSGTPFRQFANDYQGDFHLFQVGLLDFANSLSTLGPLERGHSRILWRSELNDPHNLPNFFVEIKEQIGPDTVVVFSLDADAINGADMPGVSAVNGNGLSRQELNLIWKHYQALPLLHKPIIGFYELNPVYDTLSMLSMRTLGSFLYECF